MSGYVDVLSTLSTDKLLDERGMVLSVQAGGPALFIESVLKNTGIPYRINCGTKIDVEILLTISGESGRIEIAPKKQPALSNAEWVIVSTILDEWQLEEKLPERLFVDLQGYVRDGKDFGKKQSSKAIDCLAGKIFCLKGTKEEVSYLSKSALKRQKRRLLLTTDGGQGVELIYNGRTSYFSINKLNGLMNTIGAGDTFFAYFVSFMFQGNSPNIAAEYAVGATTEFLKRNKLGKRAAT